MRIINRHVQPGPSQVVTCRRGWLCVNAGVDDNPCDEEAGKAGEESLLGQLPRSPILHVVHTL